MFDMQKYYKEYYNSMGDEAYLGEKVKNTSRMLVFKEWLNMVLKPGSLVLDIGCGDAIFAELMPEYTWYGVDINTEKAVGRIKPENLKSHDLMQTPYDIPDKSFDAIICSEVLEHLWDLRVVHKEAHRLLKDDGVYIISTPNFNWVMNIFENYSRLLSQFNLQWTIEHIRHYDYEVHKRYLEESGFTAEKVTGADAHYCSITHSICDGIQKGLKANGATVPMNLLHKWAGEGLPLYQHTIIVAARKK